MHCEIYYETETGGEILEDAEYIRIVHKYLDTKNIKQLLVNQKSTFYKRYGIKSRNGDGISMENGAYK